MADVNRAAYCRCGHASSRFAKPGLANPVCWRQADASRGRTDGFYWITPKRPAPTGRTGQPMTSAPNQACRSYKRGRCRVLVTTSRQSVLAVTASCSIHISMLCRDGASRRSEILIRHSSLRTRTARRAGRWREVHPQSFELFAQSRSRDLLKKKFHEVVLSRLPEHHSVNGEGIPQGWQLIRLPAQR